MQVYRMWRIGGKQNNHSKLQNEFAQSSSYSHEIVSAAYYQLYGNWVGSRLKIAGLLGGHLDTINLSWQSTILSWGYTNLSWFWPWQVNRAQSTVRMGKFKKILRNLKIFHGSTLPPPTLPLLQRNTATIEQSDRTCQVIMWPLWPFYKRGLSDD
jgi:hypothetical protein